MADLRVIKVGILTVSDSCYNGSAEDKSGDNLKSLVESGKCFKGAVITKDIIPDEQEDIKAKLLHWSDHLKLDVILTTGGTGFAPRDVTPEATKAVLHKEALGMTVAMIKGSLDFTPLAMLSRLVCGVRGNTLIINLPGSTKGSAECLQIVSVSIPHAVDLLQSHKSDIETTHATLQEEGIKQVHLHSSENTLFRRESVIGAKSSKSSKLFGYIHCHEKKPTAPFNDNPNLSAENECFYKLNQIFETAAKEACPPFAYNSMACDDNQSFIQPNQSISLITKLIQACLSSVGVLIHSFGLPEQLDISSFLSKANKAIENIFHDFLNNVEQKKNDQTSFSLSSPSMNCSKNVTTNISDKLPAQSIASQDVFKCERNNANPITHDMDITKLHQLNLLHPSSLKECQFLDNSTNFDISDSSRFSSVRQDLYHKFENGSLTLSSNNNLIPNTLKTFQNVPVRNIKITNTSTSLCGDECNSQNLSSSNHASKSDSILTKEIRPLDKSVSHPVTIYLPVSSKKSSENFSFKDNSTFLHSFDSSTSMSEECGSLLPTNEVNIPDFPRYSDYSVSNHSRIFENHMRVGNNAEQVNLHEKNLTSSCNMDRFMNYNFDENIKHQYASSVTTVQKDDAQVVSTLEANTSSSNICSVTKSLGGRSSSSSSIALSHSVHDDNYKLGCVRTAKIHNMNNQGELVYVPVGKAFNCFVSDHQSLKGISLYKGKRDIKKQLVYLTRQEDVVCQATSWKRGKEVLERNRLDDYFQLTFEGMEEQKQVHSGKKRDQYVVNWYMWCPGHGNCKRKCGGFGKCVENCKGMLHKQDRHNCSLMVNLKLFLSDLSTWRVHITGSHVPEQNKSASDQQQSNNIGSRSHFDFTDNGCNMKESTAEPGFQVPSIIPSSFNDSIHNSHENNHFFHSNIPSKKRISKMLSSLKKRRKNRPYGSMKSRATNSSLNQNDSVVSQSHHVDSENSFKRDVSSSHADTYTGSRLNKQSSLVSELGSLVSEGCVKEKQQEGVDNIATTDSFLESTPITWNGSKHESLPYPAKFNDESNACNSTVILKSNTSFTEVNNSTTFYNSTNGHKMASVDSKNLETDIHPTISVPDFHQPFLHANSLSDILTEASVNMSDEFSSLIDLSDNSQLIDIEQTENISESFTSSIQIPQSSSSQMLDGPAIVLDQNFMDPHCRDNFQKSMKTEDLPSYREATVALAKQRGLLRPASVSCEIVNSILCSKSGDEGF